MSCSIYRISLILLLSCVLAPLLPAQWSDRGVRVNFDFTQEFATHAYVDFADVSLYLGSQGASGIQTATLVPGVNYTFYVTAFDANWEETYISAKLSLQSVDGFEIVLEKSDALEASGAFYGFGSWSVMVRRARPQGSTSSAQFQQSLATQGTEAYWSMGLGYCADGEWSGELRFAIRSSSGVARSNLRFASPSDKVTRIPSEGTLRQVLLPYAIVDATDTSPEQGTLIRVFPHAAVGTLQSDGTYAINPAIQAIATYKLTWSSATQIDIVAGGFQRPTTQQQLLRDANTFRWTTKREDGVLVAELAPAPTIDPDLTVTEWKDASGNLIQRQSARYTWIAPSPDGIGIYAITQRTLGPDTSPFVTSWTYYPSSAHSAIRGKLRSSVEGDGNYVYREYHAGSRTAGRLWREYRPFLNGPAGADLSNPETLLNGQVTTYAYTEDWDGHFTLPSSVESTIEGKIVARTTYGYRFSDTRNGRALLTTDEFRWSKSSDPSPLKTTTKTFRASTGTPARLVGKADSVRRPDNTVTAFVQKIGHWNGTAFSETSSGDAWMQTSIEGFDYAGENGVSISSWDSSPIEQIWITPNVSTARTAVYVAGNAVMEEFYLVIAGGAKRLLTRWTRSFNEFGQLRAEVRTDGTTNVSQTLWSGTYLADRLAESIDASGAKTSYTYYSDGALETVTIHGHPSITSFGLNKSSVTRYRYDAANRLVEVGAESATAGQLPITRSYQYDLAGLLTRTTDSGGFEMNYAVDKPNQFGFRKRQWAGSVALGLESGAETYRDGRLWRSRLAGEADQVSAFSIAPTGEITQKTEAGQRMSGIQRDWLGRPLFQIGFAADLSTGEQNLLEYSYHPSGRLSFIKPILGEAVRFMWNPASAFSAIWVDMNGNGLLDWTGPDRVRAYRSGLASVVANDGVWFSDQEWEYSLPSNGNPQFRSLSDVRVSGFGQNVLSEVASFGPFGSASRVNTVTTVSPATQEFDIVNNYAYSSISSGVRFTSGRLNWIRDRLGAYDQKAYDGYGREYAHYTARRGWTTYDFRTPTSVQTARVHATYGPDGNNGANYDSAGRVIASAVDKRAPGATTPLWRWTRYGYTASGRIRRTWGHDVNPVQYTYDEFGGMTSMETFRTPPSNGDWINGQWPIALPTADRHQWSYDPRTGVVISEQDAAGKTTNYTYTKDGLLERMERSRGPLVDNKVRTEFSYDSRTRDLLTKSVVWTVPPSDAIGTPSVTFSYDRAGRVASVADGTGTRAFGYDATGYLLTEDLPWRLGNRKLTYSPDSVGRTSRIEILNGANVDLSNAYTYTADDQLGEIRAASGSLGISERDVGYQRLANSPLISRVDYRSWAKVTRDQSWHPTRDLLSSVRTLAYEPETSSSTSDTATWECKLSIDLERDFLGRITRAHFDNHDNLATSAQKTRLFRGALALPAPATPFPAGTGQRLVTHTYGYSDRGEVISESAEYRNGANVSSVDNYGIQRSRVLSYDEQSSIKQLTVPAASVPAVNEWSVTYGSNNLNQVMASAKVGAVPSGFGPEAFAYDADGNLLDDGQWLYEYDAEGRLARQITRVDSGVSPQRTIEHSYDYLGRRFEVSTTSGTTKIIKRFVWSGWMMMGEYEVTVGSGVSSAGVAMPAISEANVWGLDASQAWFGAGGAGGLVMVFRNQQVLLPLQDDRGNIYGYREATGGATVAWDFDARGQVFHERGALGAGTAASQLEHRHRTKYHDSGSNLVYYGLRFYHPKLGRFINRDPIGFAGGRNLYAMTGGDSVNRTDILGLSDSVFLVSPSPLNRIGTGEIFFSHGTWWQSLGRDANDVILSAPVRASGPPGPVASGGVSVKPNLPAGLGPNGPLSNGRGGQGSGGGAQTRGGQDPDGRTEPARGPAQAPNQRERPDSAGSLFVTGGVEEVRPGDFGRLFQNLADNARRSGIPRERPVANAGAGDGSLSDKKSVLDGRRNEAPNSAAYQITGFQLSNGNWAIIDPNGGPSQVVRYALDGKLTLSEANVHYHYGDGVPVIVAARLYDFRRVNPSGFSSRGTQTYRFPWFKGGMPSQDFLVNGTVTLQLNSNGHTFRVLPDPYDFDLQRGRFVRNVETVVAHWVADPMGIRGMPYLIIFEGSVPVPMPPPTNPPPGD